MDHLRLDSHAVKVLAHPLRARLLSELRVNGPATATQLAARISTNTGATSYHLRKLAEVKLVVDTGAGTGKQRLWAAAQRSHSWSDADVADDPDAVAASGWLRQHYWAYMSEKVARWEDTRQRWPAEWRDAASLHDMMIRLSVSQLRALNREINDVFRRHHDAALANPDDAARRVTLLYYALPTDPEDVP